MDKNYCDIPLQAWTLWVQATKAPYGVPPKGDQSPSIRDPVGRDPSVQLQSPPPVGRGLKSPPVGRDPSVQLWSLFRPFRTEQLQSLIPTEWA